MKKFLDTSNLVTYQSGKYKGKYDWSNNIGKELYFEYDGISGLIKILDYKKSKPQGYITLQYITIPKNTKLHHVHMGGIFYIFYFYWLCTFLLAKNIDTKFLI